MELVTAIINHNCNENAIRLKKGFERFSETVLIDSGSDLSVEEAANFDILLPNIFYSGLINEVHKHAKENLHEGIVFVVCSDVKFNDYASVIERVKQTFKDPAIGVYGVSAQDSPHRHMINRGKRGIKEVTFVEGFCFAVRLELLHKLCPVDVRINSLGWGLDVMLSYIAIRSGKVSVVDFNVMVFHPISTGYNTQKARLQRNSWFETLDPKARKFRKWVYFPFANTSLGLFVLKRYFWK